MQKPSYEQAERQEKIRIERALLRAMTIERSSIVWERDICGVWNVNGWRVDGNFVAE